MCIRDSDQADGAGTGVCAGHGGSEDPQGIPWAASTAWQTKCAKAHGPRHSHKQQMCIRDRFMSDFDKSMLELEENAKK